MDITEQSFDNFLVFGFHFNQLLWNLQNYKMIEQ